MKFVVARRTGRRGEGLGNEILPWAKGWIASQELDAYRVGPSWGINRRRYFRNFRTSRLDWILEDALLRLPHIAFTEADYRATEEIEMGAAIRHWAQKCGVDRLPSFIVSVEGMSGGYAAIRSARPFLWSQLLSSRDALRNVYQVLSKLDRNRLFVAVHLRSESKGFPAPLAGEDLRGRFNIAIRGDWYTWVCEALTKRFRERVQFWFFTDRRTAEFDEAVRRFNAGQFEQTGLTECSDLLLMALADLRVCSVSSYSMAASFLADGPYIWYEPQLSLRDGFYTLWGSEEAQQLRSSPTMRSQEFVSALTASYYDPRNFPVDFPGATLDIGDALPEPLVELLEGRLRSKDRRTNLLEFGCLPRAGWYPHAGCDGTGLLSTTKG